MREEIIVILNPVDLKQTVYIMSANSETIPIEVKCSKEELLSTVVMSAAKYNIDSIKLKGPKDYSLGIKEQIQNKAQVCFGKENKLIIELI